MLLYFGSGVLSCLASLFGNTPGPGHVGTVGASGALLGLIGALAIYGRRRGGPVGDSLFRQMALFGGLAFGLGLLLPGLHMDNWAHGGGLVGGALLAWPLFGRLRQRRAEGPREQLAAATVLLTAGLCLGGGAVHLVVGTVEVQKEEALRGVVSLERNLPMIALDIPLLDAAAKAQYARKLRGAYNSFFRDLPQDHEQGALLQRIIEENKRLQVLFEEDRPSGELLAQVSRLQELVRQYIAGAESGG